MMDDGGSASESSPLAGPFSQPVNAALTASFGDLDGISVSRDEGAAASMNAKAYTIGSSISLGSGIYDDISDPFSMEVISHEVAHALAGGGSGETIVDDGRHGSDPGEAAAYSASNAFRDFIAGGASGKAPKLAPAHGGRATVHRFEGGEHADAVDSAAQVIRDANAKDPGKYQMDDKTAAAMQRDITLDNGVTVSPGQITAMMGDFYGAYKTENGKEVFDPIGSFNAMQNADPKEMKAILAKIEEERAKVKELKAAGGDAPLEHTDNSELEQITSDRKHRTDGNGVTTGYSYMELAQKNSNHFNSADETSTNSNMGAYAAFHAEAMKAAQQAANIDDPDKKKALEDRALALEASSQHFMTDRFSGGHQFDKQQMIDENVKADTQAVKDAGGADTGGVDLAEIMPMGGLARAAASAAGDFLGEKISNARAKTIHDEGNVDGVDVINEKGERWHAYGDSHWADGKNAENRERASETVMNSYDEVAQIMAGRRGYDPKTDDPTDVARQTAPAWDPKHNAEMQAKGKALDIAPMLKDLASEAPVLPAMAETGVKQKATSAWEWVFGPSPEPDYEVPRPPVP